MTYDISQTILLTLGLETAPAPTLLIRTSQPNPEEKGSVSYELPIRKNPKSLDHYGKAVTVSAAAETEENVKRSSEYSHYSTYARNRSPDSPSILRGSSVSSDDTGGSDACEASRKSSVSSQSSDFLQAFRKLKVVEPLAER